MLPEKKLKLIVTVSVSVVGINVGPTFINFGFFPCPTFLLKALRLSNFGNGRHTMF